MTRSSRNSSNALAAWMAALTRCWGPGAGPNRDTSSMCESQVSGCQLADQPVVKAHRTELQHSPERTQGLSAT